MAKLLGVTYSCLYKRLQNGWTLQRLLDSKKKESGIKGWQFPANFVHICEPKYAQRNSYKQTRLDWFIGYLEKVLADAYVALPDNDPALKGLALELSKATREREAFLKQQEEQATLELKLFIAALPQLELE